LQRGYGILAWGLGFVLLAWFLKSFTDTDVPYADGFLTAGSLLGQLLLSRKNWKTGMSGSSWIFCMSVYMCIKI